MRYISFPLPVFLGLMIFKKGYFYTFKEISLFNGTHPYKFKLEKYTGCRIVFEECLRKCQNLNGCYSFAFNEKTGQCQLHSKVLTGADMFQPIYDWRYYCKETDSNTTFPVPENNLMPLLEHCIDVSNKTAFVFEVKSADNVRLHLYTVEDLPNLRYKIKLSGWINQISKLKRTEPFIEDTQDGKQLDGQVFKPFWIKWKDGIISVGSGYQVGEGTFLTITDPEPFTIALVAAKTTLNNIAYFRFVSEQV